MTSVWQLTTHDGRASQRIEDRNDALRIPPRQPGLWPPPAMMTWPFGRGVSLHTFFGGRGYP